MSTTLPRFNAYIDGAQAAPSSGQYFETVNPYTAKVWAEVARCGADDVNRAVDAAWKAFTTGDWPKLNATQRGALVHRLGDLIRENARELAEYEVRDNGKLINEMLVQCNYVANWYWYYGGLAQSSGFKTALSRFNHCRRLAHPSNDGRLDMDEDSCGALHPPGCNGSGHDLHAV